MSLSVGIVGLPNVGKSTLFNALTKLNAESANYPFCTIEPNSGIVEIPDPRLEVLAKMNQSEKIIPAAITFTDIAGLVRGASKGEGLGNQFLSHIRETSIIAHVVRCFEDDNITHVEGNIDPIRDLELINTELRIADYGHCENIMQKMVKKISRDTSLKKCYSALENALEILAQDKNLTELDEKDTELLKAYHFLTQKQQVIVCNVSEQDLQTGNSLQEKVFQHAQERGYGTCVLSAQIEMDIARITDPQEREIFLEEFGLTTSGLGQLAKICFQTLGLISYLTSGPKETRAWVIPKGSTAPKAASVIHTDFEAGFIRAQIVTYQDYIDNDGIKNCREKGLVRTEGKDYIVQEGDIIEFLCKT